MVLGAHSNMRALSESGFNLFRLLTLTSDITHSQRSSAIRPNNQKTILLAAMDFQFTPQGKQCNAL